MWLLGWAESEVAMATVSEVAGESFAFFDEG